MKAGGVCLCCMALVVGTIRAGKAGRGDRGDVILTRRDAGVYRTHQVKTNWSSAEEHCREYGDHLAVLDDLNDVKAIQKGLQRYSETDFWTAGRQNVSDSYWMWLEDIAIDPPPDEDEECPKCRCLALRYGMMCPVACLTGKSRRYLCSYTGACVGKMGEVLVNRTDRCVLQWNENDLLVRDGRPWSEIRGNCSHNDMDLPRGELASLHSDADQILNKTMDREYDIFIGGVRLQRWWWSSGGVEGPGRVSPELVSEMPSPLKGHPVAQCLGISARGLVPLPCRTTNYVICQGAVPGSAEADGPPVLEIVVGALVAVVVLLAIGITVLFICLRRIKRDKAAQRTASRESEDTSRAAPRVQQGAHTPQEPLYSYARAVAVSPGLVNGGYEDAESVTPHIRRGRVTPYATTSIESVIEREAGGDATGTRKRGSALRSVKKRLSWLLKRDYHVPGDILPTTPPRAQGPDVVPDRPGHKHAVTPIQTRDRCSDMEHSNCDELVVVDNPNYGQL